MQQTFSKYIDIILISINVIIISKTIINYICTSSKGLTKKLNF